MFFYFVLSSTCITFVPSDFDWTKFIGKIIASLFILKTLRSFATEKFQQQE
jgi:hypothetical protein